MVWKFWIQVFIFLSGVASINVFAARNTTDYARFLGTYAFEATPYWSEFEIVKDSNGFRLQVPNSDWKIDLIMSEGTLIAKEGQDAQVTLSFDASARQLQFQISYDPDKALTKPCMMAKLKDSPNDDLEREYGVKAADLIRHVRDSEDWIHQVKSFQANAKYTWVITSAGIEHRTKEVLAQFPDADLSRTKFWNLEPQYNGELQIVFDDSRFRTYRHEFERSEILRIWNGLEYVEYGNYFTHDQEYYGIRKDIPANDIFVQFMWPRSKQHEFWWIKEQMENWQDWYGRPEDFILVGKQDYRETPCYVLESCPKDFNRVRRLLIGVKDHLKYGDQVYEEGEKTWEHWNGDYKEVRSRWWFPMSQGYHIFERSDNGNSFIVSTREITVGDVRVDETLPDELFVMEFKDGVKVNDDRFGGFITYKYQKDRTEEEWAEIRQKAQQRQESDDAETRALDERIGQIALEFPSECKWINTKPLTMEQLHGKTVVLQFWGIWCGPCHKYMGHLAAKPEDENIIVIGIHTPEENLSKIKADMEKYKANGPVCVDTGEGMGTIAGWYRVLRRPYWVLIGPDGKVTGHGGNPGEAFQ